MTYLESHTYGLVPDYAKTLNTSIIFLIIILSIYLRSFDLYDTNWSKALNFLCGWGLSILKIKNQNFVFFFFFFFCISFVIWGKKMKFHSQTLIEKTHSHDAMGQSTVKEVNLFYKKKKNISWWKWMLLNDAQLLIHIVDIQ